MPIGIVSDEDFDLEISNTKSVRTAQVIQKERPGRDKEDRNIPDSLRKLIADESLTNGRSSALSFASQFDVSPSSVSAYSNGSTSTSSYHEPSPNLKNHINGTKERITEKATNSLISALNEITPEKLAEANLKTVSSVARDMAAIVKDMTPEVVRTEEKSGPTFVFYAPQIRREQEFDVIDMSNE